MLPLYDEVCLGEKKPVGLIFLIGLNILLFLFSLSNLRFFIHKFGLIPARIFSGQGYFTLFTSLFFHAGFWHLLGNMWFLWVFGANLERRIGTLRFLLFYFFSGIFSSLFYLFLASEQFLPAIGASGAVSGVLGGYLVLFPQHRIVSLVPIFFFIEIIAVPAVIFIGLWFLYQLLYIGSQTIVAYWAHIGGFLAGVFLMKLVKSRGKI